MGITRPRPDGGVKSMKKNPGTTGTHPDGGVKNPKDSLGALIYIVLHELFLHFEPSNVHFFYNQVTFSFHFQLLNGIFFIRVMFKSLLKIVASCLSSFMINE